MRCQFCGTELGSGSRCSACHKSAADVATGVLTPIPEAPTLFTGGSDATLPPQSIRRSSEDESFTRIVSDDDSFTRIASDDDGSSTRIAGGPARSGADAGADSAATFNDPE